MVVARHLACVFQDASYITVAVAIFAAITAMAMLFFVNFVAVLSPVVAMYPIVIVVASVASAAVVVLMLLLLLLFLLLLLMPLSLLLVMLL